MTNGVAERLRLTRLVQDAVERAQAALGTADRDAAIRWLERAHRLVPADGTVTCFLASTLIGDDNTRAAALFTRVLESHDVRDAWLGLVTARFLLGDLGAVRAALKEVLSRHALRPDIAELADRVARATGSAGWCGLTGEGELVIHPIAAGPIEIQIDGKPVSRAPNRNGPACPDHRTLHPIGSGDRDEPGQTATDERRLALPPTWPRARLIAVMIKGHGDRPFIGSPISAEAIGRVEGRVEAWRRGLRGWAWCPGDPDTNPRVSVGTGRARWELVATKPAIGIPDLAPLARPRSFAIPWADLPGKDATVRLRGRDGRDLQGSPAVGRRSDWEAMVARPRPAIPASGGISARRKESDQPCTASPRPGLGRWRDQGTGSVILVTHDDGGGVERRVEVSVAAHKAADRRTVVLRPLKPRDGMAGVTVHCADLPALRFTLPREQPALLRLLRGTKPVEVELHHLLNHDASMFGIIQALGVPYDAHTHDYMWFCPRIALVGRGDRYCGEPDVAACEACVAATGSFLHEDIRVSALMERSRRILSGARRVIAPSHDAAARMARHFPGIVPLVVPHEDDDAVGEPPSNPLITGTVRVCVAGAIGLHKGFHVLLGCARDAKKRGLDLTFVVAGTTIDDQRLIDTGRVFVTGPYQPDEAVALIRAQNAALALFPSIWPETWCLGLTELWRAGLRVAAFDIGAPAERIRRTGRGFLLPLGLSSGRINDALLNAARGRSFLPIRRASAYKPSH